MESKKDKFLIEFKQKTETLVQTVTSEFLDWWQSDAGLAVQNAFAGIGLLLDYRYTEGLFASYLPSLLNYEKRDSLAKHLPDLEERLSKIDANLDFVRSKLGHKIFDSTFKTILEETDLRKIESQKAFLVNAFTQKDPDELLLESCLNKLLVLEPVHLQLLRVYWEPREAITKLFEINKNNRGDATAIDLPKDLNKYFKFPQDIFEGAIERLHTERLLTEGNQTNYGGGYLQNQLEVGIKSMSGAMQGKISEFGKTFVQLIISHN